MCVFFFFTSQMDFLYSSNWIICFPQSKTVEKASEYLGVNFLGAEVIRCEASALGMWAAYPTLALVQ